VWCAMKCRGRRERTGGPALRLWASFFCRVRAVEMSWFTGAVKPGHPSCSHATKEGSPPSQRGPTYALRGSALPRPAPRRQGADQQPRSPERARLGEALAHAAQQGIVRAARVAPPHARQHCRGPALRRHVQLLARVRVVGERLPRGRAQASGGAGRGDGAKRRSRPRDTRSDAGRAGRIRQGLIKQCSARKPHAAPPVSELAAQPRAGAPGLARAARPLRGHACRTSSEKSLGCGLVKRTRSSGSTAATRCSSSPKRTAPSRRGR